MNAATQAATGPSRVMFGDLEVGEIAVRLDGEEPQEIIAWALDTFGDRLAIVTALQAEGMAILDMAAGIRPDVRVVTVDTGRLPQSTYAFVDEVRERYPQARWEIMFPHFREIETLGRRHGAQAYRGSVPLRMVCCHVRKVRPLLRALSGLDAWFTGLRREQWASRAAIRKVELDHDHGGIVKLNPLADWTKDEVWDYLRAQDVPVHPLYRQGYTSIGCDPCTRPPPPGADDRAGRWWWEENAPKECGIHCPIETGGFEHEVAAILNEATARRLEP